MTQEQLDTPNKILVYSGDFLDVFDPSPDAIHLSDIARGLAHLCRFGGQTPYFYSVAAHSILVSTLVPAKIRLTALLHDAAEAYIGDLPSPIKRHALLENYKAIEDRLLHVIARKFGLVYPFPQIVKDADRYVLAQEWATMFVEKNSPLNARQETPDKARLRFIQTFNEYIS